MRAVIQRVRSASVHVKEAEIASIQKGMLVLLAVEKNDTQTIMAAAARKIRELRIFPDEQGKMNLSIAEIGGSILAVSQFTLAGSISRGRRPSFDRAEEPGRASELFSEWARELASTGIPVKTGVFREDMLVTLENEGPVTFVLELPERRAMSHEQ